MNRNKRQQLKLRTRQERIRQERHEQRSQPKPLWERVPDSTPVFEDLEPEPEEAPLQLPSPYVMERSLWNVREALEAHDSSSVEDMNAYLDTLTAGGLKQPSEAATRDDPKRQAREIAYQAMEAQDRPTALGLAQRALALDPECVDALAAEARAGAVSRRELISRLGAIVQIAERSLGREFFEDHRGHFWSLVETRPYMRTRFDLACELMKERRYPESIRHFEAMLELNPNDNQGLRDYLLGCYFVVEDLDGAQRLLDAYNGDISAIMMWGRVLERHLAGDTEGARSALEQARERNPHVEPYLTHRRRPPREVPGYYAFGKESEAIYCTTMIGPAWWRHERAMQWLSQARAG